MYGVDAMRLNFLPRTESTVIVNIYEPSQSLIPPVDLFPDYRSLRFVRGILIMAPHQPALILAFNI